MPITPSIAEVRRQKTLDAIRRITMLCFNQAATAVSVLPVEVPLGSLPSKDVEVIVYVGDAFYSIQRIRRRYARTIIELAAAQDLVVLRQPEPMPEEGIPDVAYE